MHRFARSCFRLLILGIIVPASAALAAITATVVPSRTSGVAPLAVFFDASTTTATGVAHPMHELSFEWDFGDPTSGTWKVSGRSKNSATGPSAAHVFTKPGTYKVVLSVKDGGPQNRSKTVTITVEDPDTVFAGTDTVCFSPDKDFTGAPAGAELVTTNSMSTIMSYVGGSRRLLLKRGGVFTGGDCDLTINGPGIIGAFGPARAPAPRLTGSSNYFRFKSSDWRILDLEFEGPSAAGNAAIEAHAPAQDSLVMNTRAVPGTLHRMFSGAITTPDKLFIIDNDWRGFGFGSGGNIIYTLSTRLALLGNHLEDALGGEHIVRLVQCQKGVISHNYFAKPKATKALLTIRSQNNDESYEMVVSDNVFVSHGDQHLGLIGKNSSQHTVSGRDFIVERNFFKGDPTSDRSALQAIGLEYADNVTIRNNVILFNGWGYRAVGVKETNNVWVYNNSAYSADASDTTSRFVHFMSGSNHTAKNNLWYAPGLTQAEPLVEGATVATHNLNATTNPFVASTITEPAHFKLKASGPALSAGEPVPVWDDYSGMPRPQTPKTTLGAFEFSKVSSKR